MSVCSMWGGSASYRRARSAEVASGFGVGESDGDIDTSVDKPTVDWVRIGP